MGYLELLHQVTRSSLAGVAAAAHVLVRPPAHVPGHPPRPSGHLLVLPRCTACGACVETCPTDCIELELETAQEVPRILRFQVDLARCISCLRCSEACPGSCLHPGRLQVPPGRSQADLRQDLLAPTDGRSPP